MVGSVTITEQDEREFPFHANSLKNIILKTPQKPTQGLQEQTQVKAFWDRAKY